MIFSLFIIIVFVALSVYFYFKAEKLNRQIFLAKKEVALAKKESKVMIDAFAVVAKQNEELIKYRFEQFKNNFPESEISTLLYPLVANYSSIFLDSAKGSGRMHSMVKKCCESYQEGSYKRFTFMISKQELHIKKMWKGNHIRGFMSFMDAILIVAEKNSPDTLAPAEPLKVVNQ